MHTAAAVKTAGAAVPAAATALYPFLWYFGRDRLPLAAIALFMAGIWLLRTFTQPQRYAKSMSLAAAVFFAAVAGLDAPDAMYIYPVAVSLVLLAVFSGSLFTRQSVIERLARLQQPDLPPAGVRYTRRVTQIWCVFFVVNAAVAAALAVTQRYAAWAWYTGFFSYLLMGILFAGEYLYRRKIARIR